MKHTLKITLMLAGIFLISQIFGLFTYTLSITPFFEEGKISVDHGDTFLGETPEADEEAKQLSFIPIMIVILLGTGILLLFIKLKLARLWKYWFLIAVMLTMALSFEVYFKRISGLDTFVGNFFGLNVFVGTIPALALGALLAILKIFRPRMVLHNFTEVFIYTGIVIVIAPLLNLFSAFALLIVISIYDMFAVWYSKHMIKLANFQTETRVFAGLLIPYGSSGGRKIAKKEKTKKAVLGGGDIAFPLLFCPAVIEFLVLHGFDKFTAFWLSMIAVATTTTALFLLLAMGKKNKFYPAMPFISLGCFFGFGLILALI